MVFQFTSWHLNLGGIERSNQGHLVFIGLYIILKYIIRQRSCQAERPLVSNFDTYCPFIQNLFSNFFSILAWSFPRMVMMNCEEKDLIESL